MKLLSKLTLYATIFKTAIVLLFIGLLPGMVSGVASRYTSYYPEDQKKKVIQNISRNGIDFYFDGDSTQGNYTMLKDGYISLKPAPADGPADSILAARRVIETDTLNYRLLNHVFEYRNKNTCWKLAKQWRPSNQY